MIDNVEKFLDVFCEKHIYFFDILQPYCGERTQLYSITEQTELKTLTQVTL